MDAIEVMLTSYREGLRALNLAALQLGKSADIDRVKLVRGMALIHAGFAASKVLACEEAGDDTLRTEFFHFFNITLKQLKEKRDGHR